MVLAPTHDSSARFETPGSILLHSCIYKGIDLATSAQDLYMEQAISQQSLIGIDEMRPHTNHQHFSSNTGIHFV